MMDFPPGLWAEQGFSSDRLRMRRLWRQERAYGNPRPWFGPTAKSRMAVRVPPPTAGHLSFTWFAYFAVPTQSGPTAKYAKYAKGLLLLFVYFASFAVHGP